MSSTPSGLRPAVFVDRDGTLSVESEWVRRGVDLILVPGAVQGLIELARAGFFLVLATNQSAIARGIITPAELAAIHAHLADVLAAQGARFDAWYHCPHHPTEGLREWKRDCECRKPRPGMMLQAAREHGLDLGRSFTVGDAARDLEAGWHAGTRGVLVLTGKGEHDLELLRERGRRADHVAPDLLAAARWMIANAR